MAFQTFRSRSYAAACATALGDQERSRKGVAEAMSISPDLTITKLLGLESYRYPNDAARLRTLLTDAGLPE